MDYTSICLRIYLLINIAFKIQGCKHMKSDWISDAAQPCDISICVRNVLTRSTIQCRPGCLEQIYKQGKCCPSCASEKENTKGCLLNGVEIENGKTVTKPGEKCTSCSCVAGELTCVQNVCPVLNCPQNQQIYSENECCPVCKGGGVSELQSVDGGCLFQDRLHKVGQVFMPDKCTKCICTDVGIECNRKTCPILNCPKEFIVLDKSNCCPKCKQPAGCKYKGNTYKIGENWKDGPCTDCACKHGKVVCREITCGSTSLKCSQKSILYRPNGECCALCVPAHSICSVANANASQLSYASFDGFNFKFDGTCRYTLLQDIIHRQISIRLKNEFRPYPTVRTKIVTIILSSTSIGLHRGLDIRINRTKIKVPYKHENFTIDVIKKSTITVNVIKGFKLTWSEGGDVAIYVTPSWRDRLGGICGNFNQVTSDDMKTKKQTIAAGNQEFAESWRVGGKCGCDEPFNGKKSSCQTVDQRVRAHKKCRLLKGSSFGKCHKKVPVAPFLRACTDNACECRLDKNCECSVIKFYIKQCAGYGINLKLPRRTPCKPKTTQHDSDFKKRSERQHRIKLKKGSPLLL